VNDHHLAEAKSSLSKSLELSDGIMGEDEHFVSMIYLGLARLSIQENKMKEARDQYHKALEIEPYLPVKAEAEKFLQTQK
jgi:predicted negative regulator of RcsB-dependent stress response